MNKISHTIILLCVLSLIGHSLKAQPGSKNFGKVWMQGQSLIYTTTFDSGKAPLNQIAFLPQQWPPYITDGHSNICDASGNVILVSDGFNVYDKNLQYIEDGHMLVPRWIYNFDDGCSKYSQASIILPFGNGKYRLVTPTVSDDTCYFNWVRGYHDARYDLLLYSEIDMTANGGAGKVTKRMEPLLDFVRLSKCQMMACRHGDGKSWWLLKQAADTNMVYKFLFTEDKIYGPYVQGFSGDAAYMLGSDNWGQFMFSKDGTKYATTILRYGKVFVADFDRCTGNLSNPKVYDVPTLPSGNPFDPAEQDNTTTGVCFSPNGKYLYVCGYNNVQQLDIQNSASSGAWTRLSGHDTTWEEFQRYSTIYPGPDDKLYIGNLDGFAGQMSVINTPDNKGVAADFCRKCLRFPGHISGTTFRFAGVAGPPCMPNYALGPTNPICYPLGVEAPVKTEVFQLYPNPASGSVTVKTNENGMLHIYDVTGSIAGSYDVASSSSTAISIQQFPPGVYTYQFRSSSGITTTGKLVIKQ